MLVTKIQTLLWFYQPPPRWGGEVDSEILWNFNHRYRFVATKLSHYWKRTPPWEHPSLRDGQNWSVFYHGNFALWEGDCSGIRLYATFEAGFVLTEEWPQTQHLRDSFYITELDGEGSCQEEKSARSGTSLTPALLQKWDQPEKQICLLKAVPTARAFQPLPYWHFLSGMVVKVCVQHFILFKDRISCSPGYLQLTT